MAAQQYDSFEDLLKTFVPGEHMQEVWRVLYGGTPRYLLVHYCFIIQGGPAKVKPLTFCW